MLIQCNAYLDGFDFLLLFFEISADLLLIIGVIYQRKYEPLNNLKTNLKLYENYMKIDINYMKNRYQLYENRYQLYENRYQLHENRYQLYEK